MNTGETTFLIFMLILTPISFVSFFIVARWIIRQQGETESAERIDKIWQQRERWGEEICRQVIDRTVEPGMTAEMVALAWGQPAAVNRPADNTEQWVYDPNALDQVENYVTLNNGQVTKVMGQPAQPTPRWGPWLIIAILVGLSVIMAIVALVVVYVN